MDYIVPLTYIDPIGNKKVVDNIKVSIRYAADSSDRKKYCLLQSSVMTYIENIHFKWKIGSNKNTGNRYTVNGITCRYNNVNQPYTLKDRKIELNRMLESFEITDPTYIQIIRDKKLQELLTK